MFKRERDGSGRRRLLADRWERWKERSDSRNDAFIEKHLKADGQTACGDLFNRCALYVAKAYRRLTDAINSAEVLAEQRVNARKAQSDLDAFISNVRASIPKDGPRQRHVELAQKCVAEVKALRQYMGVSDKSVNEILEGMEVTAVQFHTEIEGRAADPAAG